LAVQSPLNCDNTIHYLMPSIITLSDDSRKNSIHGLAVLSMVIHFTQPNYT